MLRARELDRAESLVTYGVVGAAVPDLADVVRLAARVCGAPLGAVGFLDGDSYRFNAAVGQPVTELDRTESLSALVVESGHELVLPDVVAALGPSHPAVIGGVRAAAFAGVPLVGRDGLAIGALAVSDVVPREFCVADVAALRTLAQGVVAHLELTRLDAWGGRRPDGPGFGPVRLRQALEEGELVPYFHRVVDLASETTVGFEALIRWVHPQLGLVAPQQFLPTVEASGLMRPVGRHVLAEALSTLADLRTHVPGADRVRMAVNVSPLELAHRGWAEEVLDELAMHGLRGDALVAEVTETAAFVDLETAVEELRRLREAGAEIALDDYGAGHSSALRVLRLPLTMIKLDRELVAGVVDDLRARAVARSSIAMAVELGLGVVAEGVETEAQREVLLGMGCVLGQGWLFGRPAPADLLPSQVTPPAVPRPRVAGSRRRLALHSDGEALAASVAAHLVPALEAGAPAILAAGAELTTRVDRALAVSGLSIGHLGTGLMSAERVAATLIRGERVNEAAFAVLIGAPLRRASARSDRPVRVVSEVVAELWRAGRPGAALDLLGLWRRLAEEVPIDLYCAVPDAVRGDPAAAPLLQAFDERVTLAW